MGDALGEGLATYRIGPKIRDLRQAKGLALVQLGNHSGLSAGMISKIERGQIVPTLPTLLRIAMVFGVRLEHFFSREGAPVLEIVKKSDRLQLPDNPEGTPAFLFESLDFPVADKPIESYLAEFPPGRHPTKPHNHKGAEMIYVIEGKLSLTIHGAKHELGNGDSIYFDSGFDHFYRAAGGTRCRALVVVTTASASG